MLRSLTALRTVIVYRPPPSRNNKCTVTMLFNEFPLLTENLATTAGPILFAGDFNFHVDNNQDCQIYYLSATRGSVAEWLGRRI